MSSPPFDATIELAPVPSVRALTILFWLHVGVLAVLLAVLRAGPGMAGLAALVALSWILTRRHAAFGFGPNALTRLTWHTDGQWTLHDARGARWDGAELLGSSVVHDLLLVLNFRLPDGGRRVRALLGDELGPEPFRRLRARLRMGRSAGPQ
jgi:toxin CptA